MSWLSGWSYRKLITISGSSGAGSGYQVLLKVGESSGASGYDFQVEGHSALFPSGKNDGGDLRFTASDGTTLLNFWVEKVDGSSPDRVAYIWVNISDDLDNDVNIYCYYGNSSATSVSDGDSTFLLFDDFDGSSLDTSKWNLTGAGTYSATVSNDVVDINTAEGNSNKIGIMSLQSFSMPIYISAKFELKYSYYFQVKIGNNDTYSNTQYVASSYLYYSGYNSSISSNNGSSSVSSSLTNPSGNTWYVGGVKTDGNTHIGWYDGYSVSVSQSNDFQGYVGMYQVSAYNQQMETLVDWFFAKKYVSSEPAFSSAGNEELPYVEYDYLSEESISLVDVSKVDWILRNISIGDGIVVKEVNSYDNYYEIKGVVTLSGSGAGNQKVLLIDESSYEVIDSVVTDSDGSYVFKLSPSTHGKYYTLIVIPSSNNENGDIKCHVEG